MRSFSVGQLITIFSSDVHRFDMQDLHLNYLWVAPCQLFIVIYMLYFHYEFGLSSLGGLILLMIFIIFQFIMSKYISSVRLHKIVATNKRIRIITEIMESFYTIKLHAWENVFFKTAEASRVVELGYIKKTMILRILNTSLSFILTKMTVFLTLLFYVYNDKKPLDAKRVFITLLLYEHVRVNMAFLFTHAATDFAEISVTLTRLTEFLLLEEKYVDPEYYEAVTCDPSSSTSIDNLSLNGVNLTDLTCKWHPNQEIPTLDKISFQIEEGKLLAIVGPIGSGKSSLLSAILGELPAVGGKVEVYGTIAYVPQTPWLFPGTLRQNITFGKLYNSAWYNEVLEICGLETDMKCMPEGDKTKVFNAGLSVGQKARISLARAVYSNADIYLMDDPLNAVDVRQSRHILESCIRGALKNKAILLVTHQLHFLEAADNIGVLMNGKIRAHGTFSELMSAGIQFAKDVEDLLEEDIEAYDDNTDLDDAPSRKSVMIIEEDDTHRLLIKELIPAAQEASHAFNLIGHSIMVVKDIEASDAKYDKINPKKIGIGLYWSYLKSSSSWPLVVCLAILCVLVQVLFSGSDYWLEYWTTEEERGPQPDPTWVQKRGVQVAIYCVLIPGLVIASIFRSICMFKICINASLTLFCQLLSSLLHAKTKFMESNCAGQGINRFSKDMIVIDELLPTTLYEITGVIFEVMGAIIILSSLNQWFLVPCFIYIVIVIIVYKIYHKTASTLKRIEADARSPIYAHTTKTLQGLSTIRAYEQERVFLKIFDDLQDKHTAAWYLYISTHAWLAVVVDWLSILLIGAITTAFLYLDDTEAAEVGLACAKVIELSILMQIAVTECADSETEMISVER